MPSGNGGFTLIELILVTVIIGILAGMVVTTYGGRVREAQIRAAKGDIANYSSAIELFALDNNDTYPQTLEALTKKPKKLREIRNDPWGNPYVYNPGTDTRLVDYEIYSTGPDGIPGTEDDVTSSSELK